MTQPRGPEPQAPNPDAGVVFRAEMWLTNMFLGYWQVLVAVIVTGLLGVLVYGQAKSYVQGQQRRAANQIAEVESALYRDLIDGMEPELRTEAERVTMDLAGLLLYFPVAEEQEPTLVATGDSLVAIGDEAAGTAAVEAWLKASELYRLADADDKRRIALERASETTESFWHRGKGPLRYAAQGGLANLEIESGEGDSAVARLRVLSEELDGYLAEQSTLDLGLALEHLGRPTEAQTVYAGFEARWPESPRLEEAQVRMGRITGGGGEIAPEAPAADPLDQLVPVEEDPEIDEDEGVE